MKRTLPLVLCLSATVNASSDPPADAKDAQPQRVTPEGFVIQDMDPGEKFASEELLARFEAPSGEAYRLGEGDELAIEVWDHPKLSGRHVIGPDGMITLPVAGSHHLAGLARDDATKAVKQAFSSYYLDLLVTVRVDRYGSNRVYVLGRVGQPGILHFETAPSLLEAITRAGGLPVGGVGADKASLTRCAVFRGRDRVVWIDLKGLLTGNMALNIRLQRNDVVYIPDADDQLVYVLGEVHTPGAYHLTPEMSFMDALALAGGPTEDAAVNSMKIVRPGQRARKKISTRKLLKPDPDLNVLLEENDILYVPRSGLASFGYVMNKLNPFTTLLLFGAALMK